MYRVRGVAAATLLAAAITLVSAGRSAAESIGSGEVSRTLLFAGTDIWRDGAFLHGGILWSPGGIDAPGFALKLLIGSGMYRYRSGALGGVEVTGRQTAVFVLPGWRMRAGPVTATVFAGLDMQRHRLLPDDPASGLRGNKTGLRSGIELWYQPNHYTMASADVSVSTVGPSLSGRIAFGRKVENGGFAGPELQAFSGRDSYRQWRIGLHLTDWYVAGAELSAGIGWSTDSDRRDGLYARFGFLRRD